MGALSVVQLMGTSVSDGPGFLHIACKAHAGRGSLPTATLRSLVVVIGRVARSEPGLARLLLQVRARVDPPGGSVREAARWLAPLGQAGDQHLRSGGGGQPTHAGQGRPGRPGVV